MTSWFRAAAVSSLVALAAAPAPAQERERFTAFALNLSNVATGASTQVDILIDRWSTDDEVRLIVSTFMEKSQNDLLKVLQKIEPPVGRVMTPGSTGWALRYARQVPGEDGGRQILIATDREIGFREASERPRSYDYPFTLIELHVDDEGNGVGQASIATKITYDKENNVLELENFTSEPVRLMQVRKVE